MKVIIVGGVAGGATAATRIRRIDENAEIIIFERSKYVSYANCGLPYYIGDEIKNKNALTLQTPKSLWDRYRINVKVSHEVIDINPLEKKVIVKDLNSNITFEETYDKLLLAPGAKPLELDYLKDKSNVFTLRTVEDTYNIKEFINQNNVKNTLIIGAGFVGLEMAENLTNLGIDVTICQLSDHVLNFLDKDIASFVHKHLNDKCVKVLINSDAKNIIKTQGNKYDLILVSIGVKPDSFLGIKAGLEINKNGSIKVNNKMETSVKDIYAVGDAVEVYHKVLENNKNVPLAANANKEARIAADNICGIESEYKGTLSTSILKVFDLTVASTGINEKEAKSLGLNYEKVIISPANHATYYPNAKSLTLKVLFDKDTLKTLGAQAVGYDGVDKRIDVLANVMIKCNDKEERHLIVIENKAYTKIHNDQLNRYEKIINKEYGNDNFQRDFIKHFWVITLSGLNESGEYDNNYWILKSMCDSAYADWKLLSFDDVMDDDTPTGSEHFDDFWIYKW